MRPSETEKAKLTATYLNGIAIALAAIGGVGPWVAYVQGGPASLTVVGLCSFICFGLSLVIHLTARWTLGDLGHAVMICDLFYMLIGPVGMFLTAMAVVWITRPAKSRIEPGE